MVVNCAKYLGTVYTYPVCVNTDLSSGTVTLFMHAVELVMELESDSLVGFHEAQYVVRWHFTFPLTHTMGLHHDLRSE